MVFRIVRRETAEYVREKERDRVTTWTLRKSVKFVSLLPLVRGNGIFTMEQFVVSAAKPFFADTVVEKSRPNLANMMVNALSIKVGKIVKIVVIKSVWLME